MTNKKKEAHLSCIMLVNKLEPEVWPGFDETLINQTKTGSVANLTESIVKKIDEIGHVCEAYAIKHDKDVNDEFNFDKQTYQKVPVDNHVHILLRFKEKIALLKLAEHLNLEEQFFEKAKRGKYAFSNFLAYLIHFKDADKFQYSPDEVYTYRGKDYKQVFSESKKMWEKGRAKKTVKTGEESIEEVILAILEGKLSKDDILLDENLKILYSTNRQKINEAFKCYAEFKGAVSRAAIQNGEFKKTIIFITGDSGLGKTTLGHKLVNSITELAAANKQQWRSITTAATNIFDDFHGEEILLLDDIRGEALTASDWLKLLDPYHISPISARYQNRDGAARVVIITSSKLPLEFFYYTKESNSREDISQFLRRIDNLVTLRPSFGNNSTNYLLSHPRKVDSRAVRVPNTNTTVSLTYDFNSPEKVQEESILNYLTNTVRENNKWDPANKETNHDESSQSK
ncbi:AAA family ATPase [Streptococcus sp. 121]|nr:AAA family ATPase [Streptococcus sp. 121]